MASDIIYATYFALFKVLMLHDFRSIAYNNFFSNIKEVYRVHNRDKTDVQYIVKNQFRMCIQELKNQSATKNIITKTR